MLRQQNKRLTMFSISLKTPPYNSRVSQKSKNVNVFFEKYKKTKYIYAKSFIIY